MSTQHVAKPKSRVKELEKELTSFVGVRRSEFKREQEFFGALVRSILHKTEGEWESLSYSAQLWHNEAAACINNDSCIPRFDGTCEDGSHLLINPDIADIELELNDLEIGMGVTVDYGVGIVHGHVTTRTSKSITIKSQGIPYKLGLHEIRSVKRRYFDASEAVLVDDDGTRRLDTSVIQGSTARDEFGHNTIVPLPRIGERGKVALTQRIREIVCMRPHWSRNQVKDQLDKDGITPINKHTLKLTYLDTRKVLVILNSHRLLSEDIGW